jgi:splicing factor 3A subunit 2
MDYQNRVGSKKGSGGVAGWSEQNVDRRERLRRLALESIDLEKDPYIFKNHVGKFECRLCMTTHPNDASYLSHTQGKKHQTNLARRAAEEQKEKKVPITDGKAGISGVRVKKTIKIGRPGYKITKIRDPVTRQVGLLFQLKYPEIGTDVVPRYRFMSAFEQKVDPVQDRRFQYLLVAAEPYETCGFKIEAREIDQNPGKFFSYFDNDTKEYFLQLLYKRERLDDNSRNTLENPPPGLNV